VVVIKDVVRVLYSGLPCNSSNTRIMNKFLLLQLSKRTKIPKELVDPTVGFRF